MDLDGGSDLMDQWVGPDRGEIRILLKKTGSSLLIAEAKLAGNNGNTAGEAKA